jgi:hypothetical protein
VFASLGRAELVNDLLNRVPESVAANLLLKLVFKSLVKLPQRGDAWSVLKLIPEAN